MGVTVVSEKLWLCFKTAEILCVTVPQKES